MPRKATSNSRPRSRKAKAQDSLKLSKLNGSIVKQYWLDSITIDGDGKTELDNSWEQLILLLLGLSLKSKGKDAIQLMVKYNVLSYGVNINTTLVDYIDELKVKVFKLPDIGYYAELRYIEDDYAKAIRGLIKVIGKKEKDVTLSIKPLSDNMIKYADNINLVQEKKSLVEIVSCDTKIEDNDVISVSILGSKESVKSATQALLVISIWAQSMYGPAYIQAATSSSEAEVGLAVASDVDKYDTRFSITKFGDYYIYSSGNVKAISNYLINTLVKTGLAPDLIELGYKCLKVSDTT